MNIRLAFHRFKSFNNPLICGGLLFWSIGLIVGLFIAISCADVFAFFNFDSFFSKPKFFSLFLVIGIPMLAALLVSSRGVFFVGLLLIFFIGACRGFCGMAVYYTFGSGAWLLRPLLLFSTGLSSMTMWWFIFHSRISRFTSFFKDIRFAVCGLLLIAVVDVLIISPFLNCLSTYI